MFKPASTTHLITLAGSTLRMPSVGLGTWQSKVNEVGNAVFYALTKGGYRHIDCAAIYQNEKEVGDALTKAFATGEVKREEVFITSKLWNTEHDPSRVEAACLKTLADLQLKKLDLYLIHWPVTAEAGNVNQALASDESILATWREMEKLVDNGHVSHIGVSNFNLRRMKALMAEARIKPANLQIELHPYLPQEELVQYCLQNSIQVTAYSPLGSGNEKAPLKEPVILEIAEELKRTPAQILIRWAIQRQTVVIPKSVKEERIVENFKVFDFELTEKHMQSIATLGSTNLRVVEPKNFWKLDVYEE
ncbi:hypothetical protein H696_02886 [Fonticula alba]|uniref:NADP-dependent oxidoreductase domain-containing protein n=1 Tax=Fonticula alba TaxID=691883 RepID=A0A058Z8H5_FONAL|nr:hypothetical protein H696_02886 [Fonticula alba]KCV70540.1 hypothetical protein H696_02886 [Fonticula alba]|eukprot:XP_009495056.1 hypothetical protein H696_02886 [Fonticula alba]